MSHTIEMLEMRLAGLSRQVALLSDRVQECERGAGGLGVWIDGQAGAENLPCG